ncbi:hypothetical protein B0H12DRAFT_1229308 [Mycena haematopus]|nr:hypothetical protein B0H12DRAFT_1229308 [Mycena haematopus]
MRTAIIQTTIIQITIIQRTTLQPTSQIINITTVSMRRCLLEAAIAQTIGPSGGTRSMEHMDIQSITMTDNQKDMEIMDHHKVHPVALKAPCDRQRGTWKSQEENTLPLVVETDGIIVLQTSRKASRTNRKNLHYGLRKQTLSRELTTPEKVLALVDSPDILTSDEDAAMQNSAAAVPTSIPAETPLPSSAKRAPTHLETMRRAMAHMEIDGTEPEAVNTPPAPTGVPFEGKQKSTSFAGKMFPFRPKPKP